MKNVRKIDFWKKDWLTYRKKRKNKILRKLKILLMNLMKKLWKTKNWSPQLKKSKSQNFKKNLRKKRKNSKIGILTKKKIMVWEKK